MEEDGDEEDDADDNDYGHGMVMTSADDVASNTRERQSVLPPASLGTDADDIDGVNFEAMANALWRRDDLNSDPSTPMGADATVGDEDVDDAALGLRLAEEVNHTEKEVGRRELHHIDWYDFGIVEDCAEGVRSTSDLKQPPPPHAAVVTYLTGPEVWPWQITSEMRRQRLYYQPDEHNDPPLFLDLTDHWIARVTQEDDRKQCNVRCDGVRVVMAATIRAGDILRIPRPSAAGLDCPRPTVWPLRIRDERHKRNVRFVLDPRSEVKWRAVERRRWEEALARCERSGPIRPSSWSGEQADLGYDSDLYKTFGMIGLLGLLTEQEEEEMRWHESNRIFRENRALDATREGRRYEWLRSGVDAFLAR